MNAGFLKGRFKRDRIDDVVGVFREALQALGRVPGFRGGQLWVDRDSGECIGLGLYDSERAWREAEPVVAEATSRLQPDLEGAQPERHLYELAASSALEARAIVERGIEAFNRGDLEKLARDLAPNVELVAPGRTRYRGPQAVKEHHQSLRNGIPDAQLRANNMIAFGNTVMVEGELSGTHAGTLTTPVGDVPATGKKVRASFAQVSTIERGLVSQVHLYFDRMSLMAQLGLSPTMTARST
ncbi:MAG TPA: ester cyclase [Candidatus Dormibacteraeota bacterium]|jgi:predicted ester cyclase